MAGPSTHRPVHPECSEVGHDIGQHHRDPDAHEVRGLGAENCVAALCVEKPKVAAGLDVRLARSVLKLDLST